MTDYRFIGNEMLALLSSVVNSWHIHYIRFDTGAKKKTLN